MKVIDIDKNKFDDFASNHKYRNYYQTSSYGDVMDKFNYEVKYIGIENNNELIGASLLLLQEGGMKTKLAYAPRGILFDFTDSEKVEQLVNALKEKLGKNGVASLRIDPAIPLSIRDGKGNVININNEANIIQENLKNAGFSYKGETLYFEGEKPRWEAITVLENDIRVIYKNFDKRARNKINKAIKSGIEVTRDTNKDLKQLYEFIKNNGYPYKYYQGLVEKFKDKADIFYAKLNTENFLLYSKNTYEEEQMRNEKLSQQFQLLAQQNGDRREIFNKKVNSDKLLSIYKSNMIFATNMLKKYPKGLVIAGGLSIVYDNAAYLIIEGNNPKFKNLNANYLIKWRMISDYNNEKLKYINLNAVTGNFDQNNKYAGLNEMKASFNAVITEYIGEYEIILNNFKYGLFQKFTK